VRYDMGRSSKCDGGAMALDRGIYPERKAGVPARRMLMIRRFLSIGSLRVGKGAMRAEPVTHALSRGRSGPHG